LHYDDIYTYGCDLYTGATYSRDFTGTYYKPMGTCTDPITIKHLSFCHNSIKSDLFAKKFFHR